MPIKSAHWSYTDNGNGTTDHFLLGPDGVRSDVPVFSKDASGNVTGLVGADGRGVHLEGANVVTVGSGGNYATIAEAVAYINTQTLLTAVHTTTCDLTGNDLDDLTLTDALPYDATTKYKKLYLKLGTNPFYYPIESSGAAANTKIRITYPINGLATGVQAAVIYAPSVWVIKLLAGTHAVTDGTEVTLPAFVEVHGAGMGISVITGKPGTNIGILNALTTNGSNAAKDLTISVMDTPGGGSCFSVENTNATICTTGYSLKMHRVELAAGGVSVDGLHLKSTNTNVTDYVEVMDCVGVGIYDTCALLSARRARITGGRFRSSQNDTNSSTLPVGINLMPAVVYPSFFDVHSNIIEAINTGTATGEAAIGLQISSNTTDTAAYAVVNATGNRIKAKTTASSIYSSTYGITTQTSAGAPAHIVLSRNNIFDCAGNPTASVDLYANEGAIKSAGDRKITGAAADSGVAAPGTVTIEL